MRKDPIPAGHTKHIRSTHRYMVSNRLSCQPGRACAQLSHQGRQAEKQLLCLVTHFGQESSDNKPLSDNLLLLLFCHTEERTASSPAPASLCLLPVSKAVTAGHLLLNTLSYKTYYELFDCGVQVFEGLKPSSC